MSELKVHILKPDPLAAYNTICQSPHSIEGIDRRLMSEQMADAYLSNLNKIERIEDHEIRTQAMLRWFESVKYHLGYYVREEEYKRNGSNTALLELMCKRGAEDIDTARRDLYSRIGEILAGLK